MRERVKEAWDSGKQYEQYVGRWSRQVAHTFLRWLDTPTGQIWGDVGCGTGALVAGILHQSAPASVLAIDRSQGFLAEARTTITSQCVRFVQADATALPWPSDSCDITVSGLVLNFVPNPSKMLAEMVRVTRAGGRVALYVWDYRDGMEMMRRFWDAACDVTPEDAARDEAVRFPLCQPEPLKALFYEAGLHSLAVRAIELPTVFRDFDDYWLPFLSKQGSAPTYLASLDSEKRERIRALLQARLVPTADGSIHLSARAWAIQGTV